MIKTPDKNSKSIEVVSKSTSVRAERHNFVYGCFGTNRTGKSSIVHDEGVEWRKTRQDKRFRIIAHDPQDRFGDIADLFIDPEDEDWAIRCLELRNCLLIWDDFRLINLKNVPVKGLQSLLYYRAEHNIDIIYVIHNPGLALNLLTYFTTHYFIFLTHSQEGSFQKKISNYRLCQAASNQVNDYVMKYGTGKHRNDPEYDGQSFPYCIVDCEKQTITGKNMQKEISDDLKQNVPLIDEKILFSGLNENLTVYSLDRAMTKKELSIIYKKLLLRHHPDIVGNTPQNNEMTRLIIDRYKQRNNILE